MSLLHSHKLSINQDLQVLESSSSHSSHVPDDECFVYYKTNVVEVIEHKAIQNLAWEPLTSSKKTAELKMSIMVLSVPYDLPLGLYLGSLAPNIVSFSKKLPLTPLPLSQTQIPFLIWCISTGW